MPYRKARTPGLAFLEAFHRRHKRLYSYRHDRRPVKIVNLRVKAVAVTPKIPLERKPRSRSLDPKAMVTSRRSTPAGSSGKAPSIQPRTRLGPGNAVSGPALIIDPESTTFLPPGYRARVDGYLNLVIRKAARR